MIALASNAGKISLDAALVGTAGSLPHLATDRKFEKAGYQSKTTTLPLADDLS